MMLLKNWGSKKEEYMTSPMSLKVFPIFLNFSYYYPFLGIGYIEKNHKNKIRWIGSNEDLSLKQELKDLNREYEKLCAEDKLLEYWIEKTNQDLQSFGQDEVQSHYAFVTHEDLKNLRSLSNNNEDYLIIKAPKGTTLERMALDDEKHGEVEYPHQLFLDSGNEEIVPFILSNEQITMEYNKC